MKTRILCILDGFGFGVNSINNAIANAKMPNLRRIMSQYYWTTLDADGEAVGQEAGLVGNSEVGHMNIGGLQLVPQLSYQITKSAGKGFDLVTKDQVFNPREYLQSKFKNSNNKTVHLIGLFSTGTIHSDMRHWIGSIEAAGKAGADKIVLHLISDGRDSDCKSLVATWQEFVTKFENRLQQFEDKIFLGSVGGRFYAMDRDKNWERTVKGILPMFEYKIFDEQDQGKNVPFQEFFDKKYNVKNEHKESKETHFLFNTEDREDIIKKGLLKTGLKWILEYYTQKQYDENIFDENIEPSSFYYIKPQENTKTFNLIQKGDTLWLINHRSDRMKQLTQMICEINQEFDLNLDILSMNDYGIGREYPVSLAATPFKKGELVENSYKPIFKTQKVQNTLAQTIAKQGQTQLHIAETEKYAHVTYFLNGGSQEKHEGETWVLIPSNKVNSHAQKPEMKAKEITNYILENGIGKYDYIAINYANPDMVAHTGLIPESIASLEFLDIQLGRLIDEVEKNGHSMIITADHGNCEFVGKYIKKVFSFSQELNKQVETVQNLTDTEHNPNPVPCIIVDERFINQQMELNKANNLNKAVEGNSPFPKRGGSEADGVLFISHPNQQDNCNKSMEDNSPSLEGVAPLGDGVAFYNTTLKAKLKPKFKKLELPKNFKLKEKAKELRKAGNLSEVIFWNVVKNKQFFEIDFDRQTIIGNYIVDFYCHEFGLVIEIDGSSHDQKIEYDKNRQQYLESLGLEIVRFDDLDVKKDMGSCMSYLQSWLIQRSTDLPRQALPATPSKEGEFRQSNFIASIQSLIEQQNLKVNLNQLKKVLEQDNRNLINNQNWLTQDQINQLKKDQLPLWYAGVLLMSL